MTGTRYLRPLLGQGKPIWGMGAQDVLSAKIVERAGFDAIYVSSLSNGFINGLPDIGIVGPSELVELCRKIHRATSLPIIADFEQGFGEPYVSVYWMKELAAVGVAAIHIDDYGLPYKCPFIPPHEMGLESLEGTADKVRALVGEKPDPDFMVIARPGTYVSNVYDTEEDRRKDWLRRAEAYIAAGADALYAICWTVEHAKWFRTQVHLPLMTIRTLGTETPADRLQQYSGDIMSLSIDELYALGYEMYVEPTTLVGVAANAMWAAAQRVLTSGRSSDAADEHGNLYDHLERWMDVAEVRRIRAAYVTEANP
ncbi:MAG TPA: isocitrate lyase/PEP mutase family protein [Acidimicrobiales bacterium]|nr:isocitrate lyase/PEP mutase family protein [Acidimicrobiales bacterium]